VKGRKPLRGSGRSPCRQPQLVDLCVTLVPSPGDLFPCRKDGVEVVPPLTYREFSPVVPPFFFPLCNVLFSPAPLACVFLKVLLQASLGTKSPSSNLVRQGNTLVSVFADSKKQRGPPDFFLPSESATSSCPSYTVPAPSGFDAFTSFRP